MYKLESKWRDQNKEFTIGNRVIDINLSLKENDINDGDIIDYKIIEEVKGEKVDTNELSVIFINAKFKKKFTLILNKKDIFKDL